MALVRVAQYNSTPTVVEDYQAQNAHLQAFTNQLLTQQFILDSGTAQPVIKQGCYVSHGGSLYIADADTAVTGSPSDGSVYIRVSGTTSLTVEFITDISGYTWNPVYSALTSTTYTLLPYLIVKASAVWTRYNLNPNNQVFLGGNIIKQIIAGDGLSSSTTNMSTSYSSDGGVYKVSHSKTMNHVNGSIRISGETYAVSTYSGQVKITKNGDTVFERTVSGTTVVPYSVDITFNTGDVIEIWMRTISGSGGQVTFFTSRTYSISEYPSDLFGKLAVDRII